MKRSGKPFNGYLCPICVVKIPYLGKFSQHWKRFHGRCYEKRFKSSPPICYAAHNNKAQFQYYWPNQGNCKKEQLDFKINHEFRTYILGRYDPRLCQFCKHIVWKYAKCCLDCGYTCHVECQHLVASHCKYNVNKQDSQVLDDICKRSSLASIPPGTMKCELDLTYINDRLIAVSFPSFGLDDVYRHGILEVMKMLQSRHIDKYQIINVSERRYDILQVTEKGQVLNYGWPDHLAPPLQTLHQIIKALHLWLLADLKNVAVLHCKGGTSRIGMVIASYIQFSKNTPNPQRALEWFALKHYYDTKLEGAALPSQKRYVHYFGKVFEKKLKVTNKRLYFENIILHGIPYYGNGTGMSFYLKIYQSYHLCHTTKNYTIPPNSDRFSVTIDGDVCLQGDIMVKCLYRRGSTHHLIFRLQFSTDAVDGCVAAFGKYDLDEADKDNRFPDNCFVELLFSPTDDQGEENEGNEMMQLPNKGILDMDRQMRGMVDSDGGGLIHVPGPVDGNPYAQIDHTLKDKCRPKPTTTTIDTSYDLTRGIEDLEDLLVDLGHVGTTLSSSSCNSKTSISTQQCNKNNKIINSSMSGLPGTNNSRCVPDSKVSSVMSGQLAEESYVKFPTTCQSHTNSYNSSPTRNGVTPIRDDDVFTESPTVNDLLFILDKPSTPRSRNFSKKTTNLSSYDNMDDSFYSTSSEIDTSDLREQNSNTSLEAAMEIHPGTVARHVKNLQLKCTQSTTDSKTNAPKHGVPLAGLVSPTAFHGQQSPTSYINGSAPSVYKQNHVMQKRVEIDVSHQGHYYTRYDGLRTTDSCDYSEIQNEDDNDVFSKRSTLLSRSDSAYGESMRSSSSSPPLTTPSTPRIDNSYIHEEERKDTCSGESYSPKSDGVNEISSGIASRSSSMTSLDSSGGDNKHTESKSTSTWKHHTSSPSTVNKVHGSSRSVDTIDGATQTSPTPGESPSYAIENEIRPTTINDERSLSPRSHDMKMPISIRTDTNNCSTPRGILKTMDITDRKHLNGDDVFMKGNVTTQYQPIETRTSPRSTGRSTTSLGSSPDDFGVHIVDQPTTYARKLSVGSSTGSEGAHSPRSTGSASGSIGKQTMRRSMRSRGGSASSNSSVSSAELFHEIVRNPSVKFDKETMSLWYKPKISREEATTLLRDKGTGSFVVRDSQSFEGGFGLAVKVETPPSNVLQQVGGDITKIDYNSELVRHYLIEPCKKGVRLKGSSNETAFPSLMALIYQHSLTKMSLPVELVIPAPPDQDDDLQRETLTEAEILEKGACCNLVYLGGVDVESLTGDGAIHYAMNKVTSQNIQSKTTTINIKVNHKGITLTDNQRRIFFRRHYIMKDVIHCGIDPKGRKINLKTLVENCDREVECFGFVVRKETKSLITLPGNECHICAEMDPNQPASAVINFIHKAMRYSKV